MTVVRLTVLIAAALLSLATPVRLAAQTLATRCANLSQLSLPDTTVTTAQAVTAGSFTPPGSTNPVTGLPAFCRVAGVITPTRESRILFEVWMPLENWNGKFVGVGNGGWAGTISFGALPGMAHCSGGTGPNTFDMQTALEQWVERGIAPQQVIATRSVNGIVDRVRPLCPYPKVAVYAKRGDTNAAASFECREPAR